MREDPTETKVLAQADALKRNGLARLGYVYVNVDDGWSDGWDDGAMPRVDKTHFPHGMKAFGHALHERGLKFGIYLNPGVREELYNANPVITGTHTHVKDISDPSHTGSTRNPRHANDPKTRAFRIDFSRPGATQFIEAQVKTLASWGVDFIKLDFVGPGGGDVTTDSRDELRAWHKAIARAGRPMWLELSNFVSVDQAALWRETSNGWRIENDIECYGCGRPGDEARAGHLTEWSKVAERFTDVKPWSRFAGPGGWNDLDTLELGNGEKDGLTPAERQSMFSFWAISCAPLYLGSDLTQMDAEDLKLITNARVLAIDQAGMPATPVDVPSLRRQRELQVWMARYPDGESVVAVFNLADSASTVRLPLEELDSLRETHLAAEKRARDEISGEEVDIPAGTVLLTLEAHSSRLFRFAAPGSALRSVGPR